VRYRILMMVDIDPKREFSEAKVKQLVKQQLLRGEYIDRVDIVDCDLAKPKPEDSNKPPIIGPRVLQ
jgi:hypothetical protein